MNTQKEFRPLTTIAADIRVNWPKVSVHALPYLQAMAHLNKMTDRFGLEDGKEIVLRFIVNSEGWRGPEARRIKAELRDMVRKERK